MSKRSFLDNLKERHVIRTTLLYVALLWVALQAADLLSDAGIVSATLVRWLILLGVIGLPITILGSWFLESPWKKRRWTSVAGDLVIIGAVALAAALFAWQQWFTSFTRPTVAILRVEATDLREDSGYLGRHLALRLRSALATRPEIRVIEPTSAFDSRLDDLSLAEKAALVGADFVVTGTLATTGSLLRLNVQLFDDDGRLIIGSTFEERLLDQAQLQNRVLRELWPHLPLPEDGLGETHRIVSSCTYPESHEAVFAIAAADAGIEVGNLEDVAALYSESGMLQLARTSAMFRGVASAPPNRKPVMQRVAMQYLADARQLCPEAPDWELLRLANTREPISDDTLHEYPNSAALHARAGRMNSEPGRAEAFLAEAKLLDPLGDW